MVDNSTFDSDSPGSEKIITSDHSNSDTGCLTSPDGSGHFFSKNILDSQKGDHSEALLLHFVDVFIILVIHVLRSVQGLLGHNDGSQGVVGHLGDGSLDLRLHVGVHLAHLSVKALKLRATFQNDFGGAFDVVHGLTVLFNHHTHSLSGGGERDLSNNFALFSHILDVLLTSVGKLKQSDVGGRSSFGGEEVRTGVDNDGFDEGVLELLGYVIAHVDLGFISVDFDLLLVPHHLEIHLVLGEGSGLVGTNHVGTSHGFASLHLTHQILIIKHLFHGESER